MIVVDQKYRATKSKQFLRVVSGNHITIYSILVILCDAEGQVFDSPLLLSVGIGSQYLIN